MNLLKSTNKYNFIILYMTYFMFVLWQTYGRYESDVLAFSILGYFCIYLLNSIKNFEFKLSTYKYLKISIWFFSVLVVYSDMLTAKSISSLYISFKTLNIIILVLTTLLMFTNQNINNILYILIFLVSTLSLVEVPSICKTPQIDVFVNNTIAAQNMLNFINPYTAKYIDLYQSKMNYEPGFLYPPVTLLFTVPSLYLFNDIRYASIICHVVVALFVLYYFINILKIDKTHSQLLSLFWLLIPIRYYVIENAWTEPYLVFSICFLLFLISTSRVHLYAFWLAMIALLKQYAFFIVIPFLNEDIKEAKKRKNIIIVFLLSCIVILIPFLINDLNGFYKMVIASQINQPLRSDSYSLLNFFKIHFKFNLYPNSSIVLSFLLLSVSYFLNKNKGINKNINLVLISIFTLFIFGKFAFINYYYLVYFMFLIAVVIRVAQCEFQHDEK